MESKKGRGKGGDREDKEGKDQCINATLCCRVQRTNRDSERSGIRKTISFITASEKNKILIGSERSPGNSSLGCWKRQDTK